MREHILCPGHLSGLLPEVAEQVLLLAFVATSMVFAGRKYTQAIKDDIGDKSVFMYVPSGITHALVTRMEPHWKVLCFR